MPGFASSSDTSDPKSAGRAPSVSHAAAPEPGSVWDVVAHYFIHRDGKSHSKLAPQVSKDQFSSGSAAVAADEAHAAAVQSFRDFTRLCLCFGLAQGSIITTVTYATTLIGESVGSYCDGCFFGAFTLTSFCLAEALVDAVGGPINAYRAALALFLADVVALAIGHHLHVNAVMAALDGSGSGTSDVARILAYTGSLLGGIGFSLHWNGQSVLYRLAACRYARARRVDVSIVNGTFSGLFAALYVPFEMACKQAASLLLMALPVLATVSSGDDAATESTYKDDLPWYRSKDRPWTLRSGHDPEIAERHLSDSATADLMNAAKVDAQVWGNFFILFGAILCIAVALIPRTMGVDISDEDAFEDEGNEAASLLGDGGRNTTSARSNLSIGGQRARRQDMDIDTDTSLCERTLTKITETPRMLWEHPVLMALIPINVSFGVTAGFFFSYFYDKTVAAHRGSAAVGLVAAVGSGIVAVSAVPLSLLADGIGKGPVVVLGSICFGIIGVAYLVVPDQVLGSWSCVFILNALMGVGRAVWENTNKAIYADFFTADESPAAFANMYMVTGLLTFLSLFLFPSLPLPILAVLVVLPAIAMGPGYYRALSNASAGHRFRESRFKRAYAAAALAAASGNKVHSTHGARVLPEREETGYGSAVITL